MRNGFYTISATSASEPGAASPGRVLPESIFGGWLGRYQTAILATASEATKIQIGQEPGHDR